MSSGDAVNDSVTTYDNFTLFSFVVFVSHRRTDIIYQLSGEGGTRSPSATPQHLQNPKWPPRGHIMADGVWKGRRSKQLSLNKFFDPSTSSMRKIDDGEEKKIMTFKVATNVII